MRFINQRTSLIVVAVFAVGACTAKSDTQQDTAKVGTDTAVAPAATVSTTPAATSSTASTAPITKININTATDAELMTIPGMGPRMLREFKEYRPYTSIEQFRREIGKYVDKAEVARFEQYITIK
jgi:DNA uptake protein ComE-like DNA-binding protein